MKELIGLVILVISLIGGGNLVLREIHDAIRKAAIEKSAKGMPSLVSLTKALRGNYKSRIGKSSRKSEIK